ncbi:MAG: hypothetical protein EXR77_20395, partial [Myxococcales bacterium]|nr:hypothetical protein [Myxococcales bacterium]
MRCGREAVSVGAQDGARWRGGNGCGGSGRWQQIACGSKLYRRPLGCQHKGSVVRFDMRSTDNSSTDNSSTDNSSTDNSSTDNSSTDNSSTDNSSTDNSS